MSDERPALDALTDYDRGYVDGFRAASEDAAPPSDVTEDEVVEVVAEHADCRMNDSRDGLYDSAVTTGEDVWSCGVRIPFSDDLDVAGRAHLARAILDAFHVTRAGTTR